ncbi:conserved domain protein [Streptococcus constellatus subsp. pharyngis SK1060 = CCUG 46377]|uniref:Conserved domain protein n=1 Tax=Streptococcus constellatus subsp. pharyngis SK1060 = CCUG 46377 TaxID=1035184 RepID=F9P6B5_STRCV|nr:conserved domain protein [Streptococcus constellatus subsp. pharyngis SK1060 = CCUG 46377]
MTWKIVADSGCDYRTIENIAVDTLFENVPLSIQVNDEIFIDNAQLNIDDMMKKCMPLLLLQNQPALVQMTT